ncbi:MAG: DUF6261 family protein [Tannerellaceae bacterium]|jgi:hypothetical protein|nr:DUF6261 family protein [Tannerellaceae bacterium]
MIAIDPQPSFLRRLRNAEHFDLFDTIVRHAKSKGTMKPPGLVPSWTAFLQSFDKEDRIYKRAARREETVLINAAHEKRKNSYRALKYLVEAASFDETPGVKEAARVILRVMENYPALRAPMNEASALFTNFIQDAEKTDHAAKIALITGAGNAIVSLKLHNDAFIDLYAGRSMAEGDDREEGTMGEARTDTDEKFVLLAEDINAFYRANERSASKDAEVSELLSDLIRFINNYLHEHKLIFSRRSGKYTAGSGGGSHKPSPPDEEQPPVPEIPEFSISAQETLGNSTVIPDYGTQMTLRATDTQAFAAVLYPVARGGILKLIDPDTEQEEDYPVADFLFDADGTTPVGLLVDAPNNTTALAKPFNGIGPAIAEVLKDGLLLAILLDVQFPASMSEG